METLLLTRSEVQTLLNPTELLGALREAFRAYSLERSIQAQRAFSPLPAQGTTAMLLFPGLIPGVPAYTVKVHAKFPGQSPAITGVIHLHDLNTGRLLAVMDSTYITAVRTGMAGALAADVLARTEAARVAVIGAGVQGELQLRYLPLVRPISSATVYDTVPGKASALAERLSRELNIPVQAAGSVEEAVAGADIITAATWAQQPFLVPGMVKPGAHMTTLGPDQPGKCEVHADLVRTSLFACDDRDLAVRMGAIGGAGLDAEAIHAELGEIIGGARPGRTQPHEITIYGGVGLAFQDLAAAWQVYQAALRQPDLRSIDFGA